MKESEARKMWCPGSGVVRFGDDTLCRASACPVWRWNEDEWKCEKCEAVFKTHYEACFECGTQLKRHTTGYCGLGGKP